MQTELLLALALVLISVVSARRGPGGAQCGPNEERVPCGTHCEPTCAVPNPLNCPRGCVPNVCQCRYGFIRDSYNKCIRRSACPPQRPNRPPRPNPFPPNRPNPPPRPNPVPPNRPGGSAEVFDQS
ncbi:trypsin Inhibitor like cysteine rich domain protein [Ancylostoma duodenale]|uniref:Trypsin Inhibitor like cysteine rich domain protein n=1 Tax=Ancylostoma duodenale TaxID=51022 RepID=A0A0C2D8F1_9BILA|nr:trypsin Inhibitor like cysteine rich domain protein [Ancylostoma duodenale]